MGRCNANLDRENIKSLLTSFTLLLILIQFILFSMFYFTLWVHVSEKKVYFLCGEFSDICTLPSFSSLQKATFRTKYTMGSPFHGLISLSEVPNNQNHNWLFEAFYLLFNYVLFNFVFYKITHIYFKFERRKLQRKKRHKNWKAILFFKMQNINLFSNVLLIV